jgi:hypothetical protein
MEPVGVTQSQSMRNVTGWISVNEQSPAREEIASPAARDDGFPGDDYTSSKHRHNGGAEAVRAMSCGDTATAP